ncbi:MFS transporter [Chloroflexota bacterium]
MIKRVFPILAISIFSCMLGSGIVIPLLPLYAVSLGASGLWLGVIFASFPISRSLVTPVFGRISDRKGRKLFISVGLFAYGIISFGFIFVNTVSQLVLIRLLHGVAGALILPIAQAYVGDISPPGEEGKWMGYTNAAFFSGFGFGPLMGGVLSEHLGINTAFIAMGGLSLLAFVITIFFLPEITPKQSATSYPSFRDMSRSGMMNGLFTFRLALTLGRSIFFIFLPILAAGNLGLRSSLIGVLLAIHILFMSLLGIPFGRIADRVSRRFLVVSGGLISSVFLVAVPLGQNFGLLLALAVLGSVGSAIAVPAASALVVEEGRKYGMGFSVALFSMALSIGMTVGPIVGGAIADFVGINSAFYFGAVMTLLGAGLFTWLSRRR